MITFQFQCKPRESWIMLSISNQRKYITVHMQYSPCWSKIYFNISLLFLLKGILSPKIVIFSYPKWLSFSVPTFIKWRSTTSYVAKDTIYWQKRPKTIVIGIIVQDNKNSNLFICPSMWTRLEHAHCLETKQHVVLGQKRKCQRVEENGLWRK